MIPAVQGVESGWKAADDVRSDIVKAELFVVYVCYVATFALLRVSSERAKKNKSVELFLWYVYGIL